MIHICFAIHDKTGHYAKFTGTTMLSIFDNTNAEVTIHILHDNTLTQENRDKFSYLANRYGQIVEFYNIEELCAERIEKLICLLPFITELRYTIATFYRLFIPQIFPDSIKKIIYLDSDIIVNLDVEDLWQANLEDNVLGVIPEILNKDTSDDMLETHSMCRNNLVKVEDYFNAGVLLINLKILREEETTISEGTKFYAEHPEHRFNDQDILNYCFAKRTLHLPLKFNRFVSRARREIKINLQDKIFHYIANTLDLNLNDPFNRLWMNYFIKTPWFSLDTIENILNAMKQPFSQTFNKSIEKWKSRTRKYSATLVGKTRAFVIDDDKLIEWIKQNYGSPAGDEFIVYDGDSQKLVKDILTRRAKKIFFIRVGNLSRTLTEQGLIEGEDFINSMSFLKISQSGLMDIHSPILTM